MENNIYLYCRISQKKQNIERQKRNLKEAFPTGVIVEEAFSGTTLARPEWAKLCNRVTAGDTIAFDSVSRMSRNAEEGTEIYLDLYNRGVNLVFLKEPHINTDVYRERAKLQIDQLTGTGSQETEDLVNGMIKLLSDFIASLAKKQIHIAFEQSEKEVRDLQQRTKEGLATAKLNGKQLGRPEGITIETAKAKDAKKKIIKLSSSFDGTLNDTQTSKIIGISRKTFYKYKNEILAEREAIATAAEAEALREREAHPAASSADNE